MKKIINYSGIPGLILISALFFLPVSCNKDAVKENPVADNSSQLIKISGEDAGTATKTTLEGLATKWVMNTDFVGIYSPQATPTSGGSAGVTNRKYKAITSASSSAFSPESGNEMYWGTGTHYFYAYYPYSAASTDAAAVQITLSASQTQSGEFGHYSDHIGALDFMIATPKTVTSPGNTNPIANTDVLLRYNHVFSVLEFQITGSGGSLSKVWVSGLGTLAFSGGTINIGQGTPDAGTPYTIASQTGLSSDVIVTLTTPANLSGTAQSVYMMINPGTFTAELYIGLYIGTTWTYIKKTASPSGGFARGNKYIVTIASGEANTTPSTANYPGTSVAPVLIAGRFWAPKNVGYDATTRPYGLLFQWGRMYGQEYANAGVEPGPVALSVGQDPTNAANFYKSAATPYDWCNASPQQTTSWDMTLYNPCPAGWRLPTAAELTALNNSGNTWVASGGPDNLAGRWFGGNHSGDHVGSIFLSAAGFRNYDFGAATNRDTDGGYWSSEVSGVGASALCFDIGNAVMVAFKRAYGLTARCVRE